MIRKHEKGLVFIPLLMILSVGSLLIPAFLNRLDTRLISPPRTLAEPIDYYSAESAAEHAVWRLLYEAGFPDSIDDSTQYTVTVNGEEVPVTITEVEVTPTPILTPTPLPGSEETPTQGDRIQVSKTANPTSIEACSITTVTYTIEVDNVGTSTFFVEEIDDLLPDNNFNYLPGFTQILFPNNTLFIDPAIGSLYSRPLLTWAFSTPGLKLKSGESGTLIFQATADLEEGAYFNDAWAIARPEAVGQSNAFYQEESTLSTSDTERFDILAASGSTTIRASVKTSSCGAEILSWIVE